MAFYDELIAQRGGGATQQTPGGGITSYNVGAPQPTLPTESRNWGQLPSEPRGGAGGPLFFPSGGYGISPKGAGPLSEAYSFAGSARPTGMADGFKGSPYMQGLAELAARGRGGELEQRERELYGEQIAQQRTKTAAMNRLLALFGTGAGGGGVGTANPASGFLQGLMGGGTNLLESPLFKQLLAGNLGQVEATFKTDPGSQQKQLQRSMAERGLSRFTSGTRDATQATLDRNYALARMLGFGQAFGQTVQPALQAAGTATQGWVGGEATPARLLEMARSMFGVAGA